MRQGERVEKGSKRERQLLLQRERVTETELDIENTSH